MVALLGVHGFQFKFGGPCDRMAGAAHDDRGSCADDARFGNGAHERALPTSAATVRMVFPDTSDDPVTLTVTSSVRQRNLRSRSFPFA